MAVIGYEFSKSSFVYNKKIVFAVAEFGRFMQKVRVNTGFRVCRAIKMLAETAVWGYFIWFVLWAKVY